MAIVSKVRAEVTLTLQDKAETGPLSFIVDAPKGLESLDAVPAVIAEMVGRRLELLAKASLPSPVTHVSWHEAKPDDPPAKIIAAGAPVAIPADVVFPPAVTPSPRKRRGQS